MDPEAIIFVIFDYDGIKRAISLGHKNVFVPHFRPRKSRYSISHLNFE